jgi:hypothetical protein
MYKNVTNHLVVSRIDGNNGIPLRARHLVNIHVYVEPDYRRLFI